VCRSIRTERLNNDDNKEYLLDLKGRELFCYTFEKKEKNSLYSANDRYRE